MKLEVLNALMQEARSEHLFGCCHCRHWADEVSSCAPFESPEHLMLIAGEKWAIATEAEILEAFDGHPQIGDMQALRNKFAVTATTEQGQVTDADEETLLRLREMNQTYLETFGFIFIVCATGKSAQEMLALLEARINNTREEELVNGAREQAAITRLRLANLFLNSTKEKF